MLKDFCKNGGQRPPVAYHFDRKLLVDFYNNYGKSDHIFAKSSTDGSLYTLMDLLRNYGVTDIFANFGSDNRGHKM